MLMSLQVHRFVYRDIVNVLLFIYFFVYILFAYIKPPHLNDVFCP